MAATAALVRPRTTLHVRGDWSAREDRVASAVWLGVLWFGMIAGFGHDFSRYLHEKPAPPPIMHIHAAVFSTWMLLLTAQVLLVLRNRVVWHRTLGWVCVGWACVMAVLGPVAAFVTQANLPPGLAPKGTDTAFLSVNVIDICAFVVLLAWGVALRKNPAAHKRMMILSSVALADPGFARIWPASMPPPTTAVGFFFVTFYGNALLIALMLGWDWWRGRLMRSFVIGAAGLLAGMAVASLLMFSTWWQGVSLGWVQAWRQM